MKNNEEFSQSPDQPAVPAENDSGEESNGVRGLECFKTFFSKYTTVGARHYFKPETAGKYGWFSVPRESASYDLVTQAFFQGYQVFVEVGYPFMNSIDSTPAATIKKASIDWQRGRASTDRER